MLQVLERPTQSHDLDAGPWRLGPHCTPACVLFCRACSQLCEPASPETRCCSAPRAGAGGLRGSKALCSITAHRLGTAPPCVVSRQPSQMRMSAVIRGCFAQSERWQLRCWRNMGASVELTEVPASTFLGSSLAGWAVGLWWWELSVKQLAQ